MAATIDDSCRRPGAIPFSWEICPGTPKHVRSSSASVPSTFSSSKVAVTPKLTPPPSMSPSPYHSPRVSYTYTSARASSVSPSRRRPTAFIDVAPRPAVVVYRRAGHRDDEEDEDRAVAYSKCFPLPVFRRRDGKKSSGRRSTTSSSSSGSGFWSDGAPVPGGLRRSASTSSSSCLSLSSGSSNKFAEPREVEAATGWYF